MHAALNFGLYFVISLVSMMNGPFAIYVYTEAVCPYEPFLYINSYVHGIDMKRSVGYAYN